MSIEDFIIKHIFFLNDSALDTSIKAKAVLGLRRALFDLSYRKRVEVEWFHVYCGDTPVEHLSVIRWTSSQEGYEFWDGIYNKLRTRRFLV